MGAGPGLAGVMRGASEMGLDVSSIGVEFEVCSGYRVVSGLINDWDYDRIRETIYNLVAVS